jgi:hypothetical protein
MARIIFPENFLFQRLLFDSVKEKHESYAAGTSPIEAFINQHAIDFTVDETAVDSAAALENTRSKKSKQAEDRTQKRNLAWNPVFANVRDYYQFLKRFYKPNYMEVGNWGAPITTTGKIAYAPDYAARTIMFEDLKEQYDTFSPAGSSPLDAYLAQHSKSITTDNTAMEASRVFALEAVAIAKEAEDATEDRNNEMNPVDVHLRSIGNFLMALYTTNPKELGHWGFTVDDSPRAPKQVVSKVKLSSQVTVNGVIIGGTFKNIGPVPLKVYKGSTATGEGVTVLPDEVFGIAKGFSIITVVNTSNTTTGIFSTLRVK